MSYGTRPNDRGGPLGVPPSRYRFKLPPRKPRAQVDPWSPRGIDQTVSRFAGGLPAPRSEAQLAGLAKAQMDPIVAALAGRIGRQTTAGIGAIQGYTGQLAQSLGGEQQRAQGIWGAAQQAQAASDAAFAQRLSGGGAQLAGELSSRLASVNAPEATGQAAANVQQTGQGAGNAAYGTGSAALGQLIAQGASAQDYAGKLPGLAQLGGIQAVRDLGLSQQKNLADQTDQVRAQLPQILSELRAENEQRASNRTQLGADLYTKLAALGQEREAFGLDKAKAAADLTYKYDALDARAAAGKTAATAKETSAYRSALTKANSTILRILKDAAKPVSTTVDTGGGGPFSGGGTAKKTVRPAVGSERYNQAIHAAEAAVAPILAGYLSQGDRIRLVQRLAVSLFAPARRGPQPTPDIGFRGVSLP